MLTSYKTPKELVLYGLVGSATNSVGYLLYLFITHLGAAPKITMSVLFIGVGMLGFLGNKHLTFSHEIDTKKAARNYIAVYGSAYFLNLALLYLLVDKFGYPHQVSQGVSILIVAAFIFLGMKLVVFTEKTDQLLKRETKY